MTIAHAAPPPSAPLHPAALATPADRQPQNVRPETGAPAKDHAPPEVSAVAELGYN